MERASAARKRSAKPARPQDDVDSLAPEPGAFVEAVLLRTRPTDGRNGLEHASLRWCPAKWELQERRLAQAEPTEAADLRRNADLEAAHSCGTRHDEERTLRGVDMPEEHAAIEVVEASAPPPPPCDCQSRQQYDRAARRVEHCQPET